MRELLRHLGQLGGAGRGELVGARGRAQGIEGELEIADAAVAIDRDERLAAARERALDRVQGIDPLDPRRARDPIGEPEIGDTGVLGVTVRYLTPHSKWSIHSEYQDNLFMLSLSRGGQTIWMSAQDAAKVGVRDNDWIEAVNRNGVVVARAIVSHRMPEGTVYMHHAQDRLIDVPLTETSGKRGGIHNSLTRLLIKPSHLIGGYAQLTFAFNYLGPTGNQRDEVTVIRRRSQEVQY